MALVTTVGVGRPGMSLLFWSRTWYLARTILVRDSGCGCVASGCLSASAGCTSDAACSSAAACRVRP